MANTSRVTTWNSGDTLTAAALNGEFNNLLTGGINNIQDANVANGAAILEAKIAFSGSGHGHTGGSDGKKIVVNRGFGFYIAGSPSVANDLSWDPIAPEAMTCTKIWAYCKTAPTGTNLILRIFNITQNATVGSVTINTSATSGNSVSFTTPAIAQADVLRIDCTTADSNSIGANISIVLETTQP